MGVRHSRCLFLFLSHLVMGKGNTPDLESSCWILSVAPVGRRIREQMEDIVSKSRLVWVRQETEADAETKDKEEVWGGCEGKGEAVREVGRRFQLHQV